MTDLTTSPRLGFGAVPAVVVIDFARGWTDPASPMAGDFDAELAACAELLAAARAAAVPVVYTTVAYEDHELDSVMLRKTPRFASWLPGRRSPTWTRVSRHTRASPCS
jgi:maleamate amidohydrolase